jgi:carotenoid 1,2-hydratase
VFSPYYKWSGRSDPENHCSFNVALYGKRGARWAMTERGKRFITRESDSFSIGPSRIFWRDERLIVEIEEICAPIPKRLRGRITVEPQAFSESFYALDPAALHRWYPIAPRARVSVEFESPSLAWTGDAYCDSNQGEESLEEGFRDWTWSRGHGRTNATVLYDSHRRDGGRGALALRFDAKGRAQEREPPPLSPLPKTKLWRMKRETRCDRGFSAAIGATFEDTPFYSRSMLATRLFGEEMIGVHESLDLVRFVSRPVQAMLPFRMPRRG